MNCEEAQRHLVDYFDKSLDTPTMTRVATHIISCPTCGVEAAALSDCIEQIAALPVVEPPIGFAQRVMAHVRELEERPTIWQRLFSSWNKKIPIPITAAALVGVMVVILYPKEEQLKQRAMSQTAARLTSAQTATTPNAPAVTSAIQSERKSQAAASPPTVQKVKPARVKNTAPALAAAPSIEPAAPLESAAEENKAAKRPPLQVQGVSNANESSWFPGNRSGFGAGLSFGGLPDSGSRSAVIPLERSITPLIERSADIEFVVRRRPTSRRDQSTSSSADSIRQSAETESTAPDTPGGSNASISAAPRSAPIAEIRFYDVAPEHYEFFKKDLASEAIIESEIKTPAKESSVALTDRQLLIKVTILPAAAESSTPLR